MSRANRRSTSHRNKRGTTPSTSLRILLQKRAVSRVPASQLATWYDCADVINREGNEADVQERQDKCNESTPWLGMTRTRPSLRRLHRSSSCFQSSCSHNRLQCLVDESLIPLGGIYTAGYGAMLAPRTTSMAFRVRLGCRVARKG
jgi:hypothetical protein